MSLIYFRTETLEYISRKLLMQLNTNYLNNSPRSTPIEKIIENIHNLSIDYQYLTNDCRELGRMIYDDGVSTRFDKEIDDYALLNVKAGTILIEATLLEDEKLYGRLRFTLAHELAHWILHKKLYCGTGNAAALYASNNDEDATEWQANYLATAILMPKGQIKRCFYSLHTRFSKSSEIICEMSKIFEVSKQAMEIRLRYYALI